MTDPQPMQEGVFLGFNPGDNSEAIRDVDCTYALRRRAKLRRLVIPKANLGERTPSQIAPALISPAPFGLAVSGASLPTPHCREGTAADAKAMLDKTGFFFKADKAKTLTEINAGTNGFLQGDIYPFCFNLSDGILVAVANPNAKGNLGKDIRLKKDATGDL